MNVTERLSYDVRILDFYSRIKMKHAEKVKEKCTHDRRQPSLKVDKKKRCNNQR